jgi:hypothetical protein
MIVLLLKEADAKVVREALLTTEMIWNPVLDRVTKEIQAKLDLAAQ